MSTEAILQYMGIGGGAISVIVGIVATIKKFMSSSCIKDKNGNLHLDIQFTPTEQQKTIINQDPEMTQALNKLNTFLQNQTKNPLVEVKTNS